MGYLGPFSGRLGTAVGYMWNGKCCLRSYQRFVRNPRTEAQQAHRSLFKQQVQLAARMKMAINETLTDLAREAGMTAYNLFVKGNQHAFYPVQGAETVLGVDYSSLRLSMGDALGVVPEGATLDGDNVLTVSFARGTGRAFDRVYLYVYVPDLEQGFLSTPVYRREKRITLALPDDYAGHELHAWLMVKGETGGWSESVYVYETSRLVGRADGTPQVLSAEPTAYHGTSSHSADAADGVEAMAVGGGLLDVDALGVEAVDTDLSGGVDDATVTHADADMYDSSGGILEEG